jgi:hypothetical protein
MHQDFLLFSSPKYRSKASMVLNEILTKDRTSHKSYKLPHETNPFRPFFIKGA